MHPDSAPSPRERRSGRGRTAWPRAALLVFAVLLGVAAVGYNHLLRLQHEAAAVQAQAEQAELDARLQQKRQATAEASAARQKALAEAEAARRRAEAEAQARREAARQAALQAETERRKRERSAYEREAEPVIAALERLQSRLSSRLSYSEYLDYLADVARMDSNLNDHYGGTRFARCDSFREIGLAVKNYANALEAWKLQNGIDADSSGWEEAESLIQRSWSLAGRCVRDARGALDHHD